MHKLTLFTLYSRKKNIDKLFEGKAKRHTKL